MNPPISLPVPAGDINIYHARLIADQQISYVLEFAEHLNVDRLNRALAALRQAVPLLSTLVQINGAHFRRVPGPDCPLAVRVAAPPDLTRFIGTPCDPQRDSPLKLLLAPNGGGDTLCVKIDHMLSDAGGLRYLLALLAEAYRRGAITQPLNPDRGFGQVFRRVSLLALLRAARRPSLPVPGPALLPGPFGGDQTFIEHACLDPIRFGRLRALAKQTPATINDLLLAALYQTAFKYLPADDARPYPVMVPVDMRRYLPAGQRGVVGNLASAIYPSLAAVPGETFAGTLARVKTGMEAFKQADPGLGALLLMAFGALRGGALLRQRYQQAAARGSRFINFTNFGVLTEAELAFDPAPPQQVFGVGPIQYPPGFLIALSTYRDTLHLVVQGRGHPPLQASLREFLQSIVGCLP